MIVRDVRRLVLGLSALVLLVYLYHNSYSQRILKSVTHHDTTDVQQGSPELNQHENSKPNSKADAPLQQDDGEKQPKDASHDSSQPSDEQKVDAELETHHELFSSSTLDKKYFAIDFSPLPGRNPNIIPHPTLAETWLVVAQLVEDDNHEAAFEKKEISCNAVFKDGVLRCVAEPSALPIAKTAGGLCKDDHAVLNLLSGPHDARAFWGPQQPYVIFGSNSRRICLGQFTQDLRMLVDNWKVDNSARDFPKAVELQRPPPLSPVEKNWFFFWDNENQTYVHYDIVPKRVFAKINSDGSPGPDLAPQAQVSDKQCLTKVLPHVTPEYESIHQATNSLLITLCKRREACVADDQNTIIFTVFHHKSYRNFHAVYEPYVLAFRRRAPFELYGISRRPFWVHGREKQLDGSSEMVYITSISWKSHEQQYHGFMDDTLFLAFGIEDKKMGAMDVSAEDILANMELC